MDDGAGFAPDPDRSRACPDCGWAGSEAAMRGTGAGDAVDAAGADLSCPRCGAPLAPAMPSVPEILAARRTPLPED